MNRILRFLKWVTSPTERSWRALARDEQACRAAYECAQHSRLIGVAGLVILIALVVPISTRAQQAPPQQQMPSQLALQLTSIIGQWAQTLEAQQHQMVELQSQLIKSQARVKELEEKYEPKAAEQSEPKK
jgi:hypothetical protein